MTEPYKIIEVKESVFADNDREAARLRTQLKQDRTFLLNLMSSPGSGKTTTLLRTLEALKDELRIGVMEADIDSDVDAKTIADAGVKSIQLHTGGMCHLDASMTEQGLKEIGTKDLDLVVLENVGNLVCPAEFDTGAVKNAMILSVPEGHDKPLKYPLIFTVCDALIINKIDRMSPEDFQLIYEEYQELGMFDDIFGVSALEGKNVNVAEEMNAGKSAIDILSEYSGGEGMDLTGCTTEEMLYIIGRGTPVIAMTDSSNAVLLIGYDTSTVTYIDPADGGVHTSTAEEIDSMVAGSGHTFIGYVK